MAIATTKDLETSLLRSLTPVEEKHADQLLERAERLLLARIPNLYDRTHRDDTGRYHELVADVEAEAVARVLRAPGAGVFTRESTGEHSFGLNLRVASGLLDILDAEWEKLGVTPYGTVQPVTDGYLRTRYRVPPPWQFQYGDGPEHEGMSQPLPWGRW